MGVDKIASKSSGSGFFNLFDWNKKSLKKILSRGDASLEEKTPESRDSLDSNNNDKMLGVSNIKGTIYSCASSVTDEEEKGTRGPGVVARLMGLDSMPTSGISEPCSTPFRNSVSLRDDISDISHRLKYVDTSDAFSMPLLDLSSPKTPSSPFERFQREPLPPRLARPIPISHKLLSPVRSPRLSSINNASQIIEAAAKILEPKIQNGSMLQTQSSRLPSSPLRVGGSREIIKTPKKIPKFVESTRESIDSQRSFRGEASNGSSSKLENSNAAASRSFPCSSDRSLSSSKGKDNIVSTAAQAKFNIQRRDESGMKSGNTLVSKRSSDNSLTTSSCETGSQKHNRSSLRSTSEVLRSNSRKQNNGPKKSNLIVKPLAPNQQGHKSLLGDSSRRKKSINKVSPNEHSRSDKGDLQTSKSGREKLLSNNKDLTRKKKIREPNSSSKLLEPTDNITAGSRFKQVTHIFVLDENAKPSPDNSRSSSEVVSFTFMSPIQKSIHLHDKMENKGSENGYLDALYEDNVGLTREDSCSQVSEEETESLGLSIERKLRNLEYGAQSPYCKVVNGRNAQETSFFCSSSTYGLNVNPGEDIMGPVSGYNDEEVEDSFPSTTSLKSEKDSCVSCKTEPFDVEDGTGSCISIPYFEELDHQGLSPPLILDNSFSNGICSSESWQCGNGSKIYDLSTMSREIVESTLMKMILPLEQESELCNVQIRDGVLAGEFCQEFRHKHSCNLELDYVREILINWELMCGNFVLSPMPSSEVLAPVIFDKLEESINFITANEEDKDSCVGRKLLFDSVNECLEVKFTRYFQAGYQAWAKGISVLNKNLAEDIYEEISGWRSNDDKWVVDELVEKDMSTHLGRWTNEIESFETGIETENEILEWLIDEIVSELK